MLDTPAITRVRAHAFHFPTDAPEADGTIAWNSTTMVLAEVDAAASAGSATAMQMRRRRASSTRCSVRASFGRMHSISRCYGARWSAQCATSDGAALRLARFRPWMWRSGSQGAPVGRAARAASRSRA